jgi:lipopolysaccharide transport system ATP-binding protein
MSDIVLSVENLSKQYRIGEIGTGTLSNDIKRWWAQARGKEDPFSLVGQVNDRTKKAESDFVWALRDINFEVKQGEVLGIIGKNGAGKSTLLKLISRITAPTVGSVKIKGRIASLLEVGTGMHPEMTARENIYLNGAIMGMNKREISRKFDEIVDFAGCALYVDTPVKRYSSGMRVRLGFAVAAFLEPEILIVDEVLAVGDAEFQKKAIGKMKEVSQGGGRTVLFVSHNMASVRSLCDTAIILNNGGVTYEGTAIDAVDTYIRGAQTGNYTLLSRRTDYGGRGRFKFDDIQFLDENGNSVYELISGRMCMIKIKYKNDIPDFNLDRFIFGLNFIGGGNLVTGFSTIESGLFLDFNPKEGEIILKINKLPLRGGAYSISLFSSYGTTSKDDLECQFENAINLTVLAGDYWNTNRINRKGLDVIMDMEVL